MTLEQAKTLIGIPVRTPVGWVFKVENIRQLEDGMILAYDKNNWCCNVSTLRDVTGKRFEFDKENLEGDSE